VPPSPHRKKPPAEWDTTKARGQTRDIDFDTSEGTWMALDQSPDGKWIVFDLLGHNLPEPASGGKGESLTQDSGIALNMQPRYSPDGKTIAFISDRKGQNNLWLMDADGRILALFLPTRHNAPSAPSGLPTAITSLCSVRVRVWKAAPEFNWTLVLYHKDGGSGIELVAKDKAPGWHSVSRDGNISISMCKCARRFPSATPTRCSAVRNCAA